MQKFAEILISNPLIHGNLQACFILDFDLLRRPQLDQPFMARVDIAMEPAEGVELFNIFLGQDVSGDNLMGMIQVNGFSPATPAMMANLTPQRKEIWREARETLNTDGSRAEYVGLVEIVNAETEMSLTFPMHIQKAAMQLVAKNEPFQQISAVTGKSTFKPFSVETCMECVDHFL